MKVNLIFSVLLVALGQGCVDYKGQVINGTWPEEDWNCQTIDGAYAVSVTRWVNNKGSSLPSVDLRNNTSKAPEENGYWKDLKFLEDKDGKIRYEQNTTFSLLIDADDGDAKTLRAAHLLAQNAKGSGFNLTFACEDKRR